MCIIQRRWGKGKGEPFFAAEPAYVFDLSEEKIPSDSNRGEGERRKSAKGLYKSRTPSILAAPQEKQNEKGERASTNYKAMDFLLLL